MSNSAPSRLRLVPLASALVLASLLVPAHAQERVKTVFVISMENTNWTQNAKQFTGSQQQIFNNPAAPFLNGLVNGTLATTVNGQTITSQTSFATAYHNVLATPTGAGAPSIHPSEPNYIWAEGGSNFGVLSDNTPYGAGGTNQNNPNHLSTLLTSAGKTWKSYQEDIDMVKDGSGKLTSAVAPQSQWNVPLTNVSGTNAAYTNPYNGSHQYDYAAKHNPMAFFSDTNGGNDTTHGNPLWSQYAPLQQLKTDLDNNTVADYNWITPDQFNDMHSALSGSFTYNGVNYLNSSSTSGAEKIAQGDSFLSKLIPTIMASQAYQDDGAIVLWWDESEPDGTGSTNDFNHTIPEIVISKLAAPNVGGKPFASSVNLTHSDDLRTMQDIFGAYSQNTPSGYLADAVNGPGLKSLFANGAVAAVPEPSTYAMLLGGLALIGWSVRRRTR